jgi:hypothetical protein
MLCPLAGEAVATNAVTWSVSGFDGDADSVTVGGAIARTTTLTDVEPVDPAASVTVNTEVYEPEARYVCEMVRPEPVDPSPKLQL